jgi:threonine aldolase
VFPVETNIVVFCLKVEAHKEIVIQKLKEQGILVSSFGDGMIRLVVHLDIVDADITKTCNAIQSIQLN